jgi:hypothetical protein
MQFHAYDFSELKFRCEEHSTAHPRTEVNEGGLAHPRGWLADAPAPDQRLKHRRRDPKIRRCVPVVPVTGGQMPASYEAACLHAKL